jgi:hypothetical protein
MKTLTERRDKTGRSLTVAFQNARLPIPFGATTPSPLTTTLRMPATALLVARFGPVTLWVFGVPELSGAAYSSAGRPVNVFGSREVEKKRESDRPGNDAAPVQANPHDLQNWYRELARRYRTIG